MDNGSFLSNFWSSKVYVVNLIISFFNNSTGSADAHLWANISYCCAVGALSYELDLVFKDYQRANEDIGEEAVKNLLL